MEENRSSDKRTIELMSAANQLEHVLYTVTDIL